MNPLLGVYSLASRAVCRLKAARVQAGFVKQRRPPLPVVSVGNLTLGGSEKTPLVMELLARIPGYGLRPALVTRGYRGEWERAGGVVSDGKALFGDWKEAGDEPFMAARRFPQAGVFVGKDRYRSCLRAEELGFDVAILDDGFQHIRLSRNMDIVLHDPGGPRVPLREGIPALKRADILLLKKNGDPDFRRKWDRKFPSLEIFDYRVVLKEIRSLDSGEIISPAALGGKKLLAFCGIARPERFFALLEESGITPKSRRVFPDHFFYPPRALAGIAASCRTDEIEALITTEKDGVKLLGRSSLLSPGRVYILAMGLEIPEAFFDRVAEALGLAGQARDSGTNELANLPGGLR